jgi:hypothetical protein
MREVVPMPSATFLLSAPSLPIQKPIEAPLPEEVETTDLNKALEYAGHEPGKTQRLSFDCAVTVSIRVMRYPVKDGTFWVRVASYHFQMAFGNDISNGCTSYCKHPWENRVSGACPPTLGENGIGQVEWRDVPEVEYPNLGLEIFSKYCAVHSLESQELVANYLRQDARLPDHWKFIWADPETGRISNEHLHHLADQDDCVAVVECNELCPCQRQCKCCFTTQGPAPQLMLFYSVEKGWGVVATEDIEPGQLIAIYSGQLRTDPSEHESGEYYFTPEFGDLRNDTGYDASTVCNISRFVNAVCSEDFEPREIFGEPNVMALNLIATTCDTAKIAYFTRRKVFCGEELVIYYGPWFRDLVVCHCNKCVRSRANRSAHVASRVQGVESAEGKGKPKSRGRAVRSRPF